MSKILKLIMSFLASALVLSCSNEPVSEASNNSSMPKVSMGTMHNELLNEFFKTATRTNSAKEINFKEILSLSYEILSRHGVDEVLTLEMRNECEELVEDFVHNWNTQGYSSLSSYFEYLDLSPSIVDELRTAYVADALGSLAGGAIGGVVGGLAVSAIFSLQVDTYDPSTPPGEVD